MADLTSDERSWWVISVTPYGSFEYFGTESEAEEMRQHKARWEGGTGRKRLANESEIAAGRQHLEWQQKAGYPMDERELEGLR